MGLAGATAVAGAGWALEAAALPPPEHADQVAAAAIGWLAEHPFAVDVFHAGHHRLHGACTQGSFRAGHGRGVVHGTLISLRPGPVVVFARHHQVVRIHGAPLRFLPPSLAAAVGCPRRLASTLDRATHFGDSLRVERSYAANQPALKLELRRVHDERLTLYVSPQRARPLVAILARDGKVATARIYLGNTTPQALRHFHISPWPNR